MAQAETILQHRIDCLDRKLTAKQIEELAGPSWPCWLQADASQGQQA